MSAEVEIAVEWPRWTEAPAAEPHVASRPLLRRQPANPFESESRRVPGRLVCVRTFSLQECRTAIALNEAGSLYLQKSVRRAIEVRIRRLEREACQ